MKKTSDKWSKRCRCTILDPDGWDRKNFEYSWFEEKITRKEFEGRTIRSTILGLGGSVWKFPFSVLYRIADWWGRDTTNRFSFVMGVSILSLSILSFFTNILVVYYFFIHPDRSDADITATVAWGFLFCLFGALVSVLYIIEGLGRSCE